MHADEQSEVTSNLIAAESAVAALPMTLVDPTGQTSLAPYDPKVLAFIDEDMEIRNPYFSPCGRFLVDPVKAYGFVETHTGGGCMALDLPHGDGTLRLVQDGIFIGDPHDWKSCTIFFLSSSGEDVAYCDLANVPMYESGDENVQLLPHNSLGSTAPSAASLECLKQRYRSFAIEKRSSDDLEVDSEATVTLCERGAFVQASIWVPFSELSVG